MKKYALSIITVIITTNSVAFAESRFPEPMTCVPTKTLANPSKKTLQPQAVKDLLVQLRKDLSEDELNKILGEPVLKSLDSYSQIDSRGINANYAAAVVAGAAVAVVDYVWDKYVGNGRDRLTVPQEYFDFSHQKTVPPLAGYVPDVALPGKIPTPAPLPQSPTGSPYAMTPAVAVATAGAVAYKAAEYALRSAFGDPKKVGVPEFDIKQFDASMSRN